MKKFNSVPYDSADYLKTADDVIAYLEASLEENDPEFFIYALSVVARSKGMSEISQKTGLGRESLYIARPKTVAISCRLRTPLRDCRVAALLAMTSFFLT